MMKLRTAFEAGRRRRWLSRLNGEGGGAVAFAAAAPLIVLSVARNAPRGAIGKLSVAATSTAAVVTATVGYDGVAPSNFGSALGYGAFRVTASATSHALVADSHTTATP